MYSCSSILKHLQLYKLVVPYFQKNFCFTTCFFFHVGNKFRIIAGASSGIFRLLSSVFLFSDFLSSGLFSFVVSVFPFCFLLLHFLFVLYLSYRFDHSRLLQKLLRLLQKIKKVIFGHVSSPICLKLNSHISPTFYYKKASQYLPVFFLIISIISIL